MGKTKFCGFDDRREFYRKGEECELRVQSSELRVEMQVSRIGAQDINKDFASAA